MDPIFDVCVRILLDLAEITGTFYKQINVIIFCIVWPCLTESEKQKQYMKRESRERNRIEGDIGNTKEHYGGNGIRYHYVEGSEMWVRLSFLAKNLKLVTVRI
ncbi:MAG: hypothetical protein K8S27_16755 [Candidatus Omnitrophica bacterium]|nr:hypothetical protein [Candidatus Omnitrophota bacterium]